MKHLILCCLLLLTVAAIAQEATPSPDASATPQEAPVTKEHPAHDALRVMKQHMEDAMNARDIDALLEGVTNDVVFTTMNDDVVRGKSAIKDYFDTMMTGPNAKVKEVKTKFEVDELTTLYSGSDNPEEANFGIAYGHSEDEYTLADGTHFQVRPRWSAAMVRDNLGWKIANFHYSVNMFDNPVVGKMKSMMIYVGMGALVLGLAIGFFLGRRTATA